MDSKRLEQIIISSAIAGLMDDSEATRGPTAFLKRLLPMATDDQITRMRMSTHIAATLAKGSPTEIADFAFAVGMELGLLVGEGLAEEHRDAPPVTPGLRVEIREALEGDSNDAERDALVRVADALGIHYGAATV